MASTSISPWRTFRRSAWRVARPLLEPVGSLAGTTTREPVVALTFDDGPEEPATSRILDVLAAHQAHATFFLLADRAEAAPGIVARIQREGHDVGLHGADHTRLTRLGFIGARRHLLAGRDRLSAITGQPVRYFRPPHGAQSLRTFLAARSVRLLPVIWSDDSGDWRTDHDTEAIVRAAAVDVAGGAIVVLHDGVVAEDGEVPRGADDRVLLVEQILDALAVRDFRSVTVSALLRTGGVTRRIWFRP